MNKTLIQIQVFYEIAMAIGTSYDLQPMLKTSLKAYLSRLVCSSGIIISRKKTIENNWQHDMVFSIPRQICNSESHKEVFKLIPEELTSAELGTFLKTLPLSGQIGENQFYYIMDLPDFGLIVLYKKKKPLDSTIIQSLRHLNSKLAQSAIACLQQKTINDINENLLEEIVIRRKAEEQLRELLDELEFRVEERTKELRASNKDLKAALAEVKTLSGLLPICAYCKKIRDDGGYWNQIETYVKDRSDADFSHSICPTCSKKLYPDIKVETT